MDKVIATEIVVVKAKGAPDGYVASMHYLTPNGYWHRLHQSRITSAWQATCTAKQWLAGDVELKNATYRYCVEPVYFEETKP